MPVRQYIHISLMVIVFAVTLAALSGCQTMRGGDRECAGAGVPTLEENSCLIPRWIAFAHESQRANESWRSSVASRMSDDTTREELVRAVTFGWSSQGNRLAQANTLYRNVTNKVPDPLRPLVMMWQTDLDQRQKYITLQQQRTGSNSAGKQAQSARISALEQSNADLKRKLAEMANIEASMDRRRGAQ